MTNMQLLEAIGMLDEQTVLDAEEPVAKILPAPRARMIRQISAIAACVCLLFGGALALQMGGMRTKSEEPAAPADGSPTLAAGTMSSVAGLAENPTGDEPNMTTVAATTEATTAATYVTTTTAAWTTTTGGGYHTTKRDEPNVTTAGATSQTGFPATEAAPEGDIPAWPVYEQDMNGISNTQDSEQALQAVGLQRLAVLDREGDATFAVRDGRLYFKQSADESRFVITDLGGDYMESAVDSGYTLQYELEYTAASTDAFVALITDMRQDGKSLRRFALHAAGTILYDTVDDGLCKPVYETSSDRLQGIGADLINVRLTVRLQWHPDQGHSVFVKTADMIDFIEIGTALGGTHTERDGYAIGLSLGGTVEGYLDNIQIWMGYSDEPSNAGIHYAPYTKAPQ